jgi:hypothetical protein
MRISIDASVFTAEYATPGRYPVISDKAAPDEQLSITTVFGIDTGAAVLSESDQSENIFVFSGGCHCGAVRFDAQIAAMPVIVECNCSICSKSGSLHLIVPKSRFRLLSGE